MLALKIIFIFLGLLSTVFGYFIFFKKKYGLINGFETDLKAGRKTEDYAKRVGMTEFIAGIVLLTAGTLLIIFI